LTVSENHLRFTFYELKRNLDLNQGGGGPHCGKAGTSPD